MGSKVINEKHRAEREEKVLEEFIAAQQAKRKTMIKSAIAIVLCVGLIFAFCLPSISMLLS